MRRDSKGLQGYGPNMLIKYFPLMRTAGEYYVGIKANDLLSEEITPAVILL